MDYGSTVRGRKYLTYNYRVIKYLQYVNFNVSRHYLRREFVSGREREREREREMGGSPGDVKCCDVGEAKEGLENEL